MPSSSPEEIASNRKMGFIETMARRFFGDYRLLILTLGLILAAGGSSLTILPRMEDPVLTPRVALVVTRLPGADAQRVESLVTEKIESALRDIEEIDEVRSVSRAGISTVSVQLRETIYETEAVWADVRSKVEDAIPLLPQEAARPVFDEKDARAYAYIFGLAWQSESPADLRTLRRLAVDLQDRLQDLPGTEVVDRFGDPGEEISVEIDPTRAAALGLSATNIAQRLGNYDAKNAAGQLLGNQNAFLLEVGNQLESLQDISAVPIAAARDRDIRLGQIADVELAIPDPMPRFALMNGKPAVVLAVMVRKNSRIDRWTDKAEALLDDYARRLPAEVAIDRLMIQNDYVEARLDALLGNLILGALAVAGVVLLMMGWRSAMVVTLTLPLASLMVLFGMRVLQIPIHQMSVTGLIIAFGLLIDNAIVVVDEVKKRIASGDSAADAMAGAVKHLSTPLLGSTLTTAFAFAPIALTPGPGGEFIGAIAISVILAIGSSFLLALTVIPTIAARVSGSPARSQDSRSPRFLQQTLQGGISFTPLTEGYRQLVRSCIARPWLGLIAGISLPILGFIGASSLQEQFFPPTDRNQFHIQVELPITASMTQSRQTAAQIDRLVRDHGAARTDWFFGDSAPEFYYNVVGSRRGQPNYAQAIVTMGKGVNPGPAIRKLQNAIDQRFTIPRVLVRQLEQGPPFEAPVEMRIFGDDFEQLRQLGEEVRRRVSSMPEVVAVRSDLSEALPQLSVAIDEAVATSAGITPAETASQLAATLDGIVGGSVLQDNEQLPVRVRVSKADRKSLGRIESMDVVLQQQRRSSDNPLAATPLSSLAALNLSPEVASITRLNRKRMNEISVYLQAGVLPSVVQSRLEQSLADAPLALPVGYRISFGGEADQRDEAVGNLFSTVGLLGILMAATLVLSFGSFRMAMIIGLVGFLSIGLALLALTVGGYPFGFVAIIGTMGLIGVAINDSIVVLAGIRTNQKACAGDIDEATNEVLHATRHVIATTLTTMAGFLPLIIAGGTFWPPLAVAISGGVLGASLLALILVPALHHWLIASNTSPQENLFLWLRRSSRKSLEAGEPAVVPAANN